MTIPPLNLRNPKHIAVLAGFSLLFGVVIYLAKGPSNCGCAQSLNSITEGHGQFGSNSQYKDCFEKYNKAKGNPTDYNATMYEVQQYFDEKCNQ